MHIEPAVPLAFAARDAHDLEIRVNFGVFAGREATPAELDDLARALVTEMGAVSIVSEQRHEIGPAVEASVHQVRVELDEGRLPAQPAERDELVDRLVEAAERWARTCIADRSSELGEL